MHFDINFVKNALPKAELLYDLFPTQMNFSIDSRTISKGDIFVAIVGSKYDSHDFVNDVIEKGAAGLIISNRDCLAKVDKKKLNDKLVLLVDNTIVALGKLAAVWRSQFNYPVIGITGSVGKTSTKQIIENMLNLHGLNSLITTGNQNSLIGLPLNVLRMRKEHQVAIFELGVNKRGEMASLVEIAKPTIALITSVGHSHMEGLGSIVDVATEKREIFKFFKEDNIGIINGDQAPLAQIGYHHPVIKFGSKITNQIQARKIRIVGSQINFVLKIYKKKYNITLNSNHLGAIFNSMAAISVGCLLNISDEKMIKAIQLPIEVKGRFEQKELIIGEGKLIDDCYNASPESMKAALLAFEKIETNSKKIAVLGDMLELGSDSSFWHRQIGRFLRKVPSLSHLILVGDLVKWTKMTIPVGLSVEMLSNWQEASKSLKNLVMNSECLVLVKGSTRGYTAGLANLVKFFTEKNNGLDINNQDPSMITVDSKPENIYI